MLTTKRRAEMLPRLSTAMIPVLAIGMALLASGDSPRYAAAKAEGPVRRSEIKVTNTKPEFTLTLPDRYLALKSTGEALCTFGTTDRTTGALVAVYGLHHTIEPGATDLSAFKQRDVRRVTMTWQSLTVDVIGWHTTAKDGKEMAARWVQIPLVQEAVSILVLIPAAKEELADGLMQDFLTGLVGPSNWRVEESLSPAQRGACLVLGLAMMLALIAGPPLGVRARQRSLARKLAAGSATTIGLRALDEETATAAPRTTRYYVRVTALVLAIIGAGLAYLGLIAVAVSLLGNLSFADSYKAVCLVLEVASLIVVAVLVGIWIVKLRDRGGVLLDFGPDPGRKVFLVIGVFCLLAGFLSAAVAVMASSRVDANTVVLPAIQVALAVQFLVRATGRVQVTEKGLWQSANLLPWKEIGSYRWLNDSTLVAVKGVGPISFKMPVPIEHKNAVDDLLTRHGLVASTS